MLTSLRLRNQHVIYNERPDASERCWEWNTATDDQEDALESLRFKKCSGADH